MDMVIIASSPRVGSSLLSDLLTKAGAGYVSEHFNLSAHVPRVAKENGLKTLQEHFDFVSQQYTNSSGDIFSVKCHFDQFFNYSRQVDIFSRFNRATFIQIKRRSNLDQAISYFLAKATDTWSSKTQQTSKAALLKALRDIPAEALYSEILRMSFRLQQNEAYWDFYLSNQDNPVIYYEDLLEEQGIREAEAIFSSIYGRKVVVDRRDSALQVQRDDEVNNFIKQRIEPYLNNLPAIGVFDSCMQFNNNFYGYAKR